MESKHPETASSAFIEQNCSECGKPLQISVQFAGQFGKCPHCGGMVLANHAPIRRPAHAQKQTARLVALDVLRGFDMFWIIGADSISQALQKSTGGDTAPGFIKAIARQLEHVRWEWFRFYDLIFPLFIFMVGMSAVFSLTKILARDGKPAAMKRTLRRAVLLFLLGVLYDMIDTAYADGVAKIFGENLLCGVLQRIALCYLATGLLLCGLSWRGLLAIFAGILITYWAVLTFIPAPGEAEVVFERGRNIIHYIDQRIPPYGGTDPESLMTTFPAIATCIFGALIAFFVRESGFSEDKQAGSLLLCGLAMVILGYLWGMQMPIIKRLWTPSYVFVAGGYSIMLLGLFIWIIDVMEWEGWVAPFLWIGANSISVYFFDMVVNPTAWGKILISGESLTPGIEAVLAVISLALSLAFVHILYRKQIFIRV